MSGLFDSTAPRFFRPDDVGRIQRNQRRINVQRAMGIARRIALAVAVIGIALWMVHRAQSDKRFAVKTIEVTGATHVARGTQRGHVGVRGCEPLQDRHRAGAV